MAKKGSIAFMDTPRDFADLEQEKSSWWYLARRSLLREFVSESLDGKREGRILDVGGTAELDFHGPLPVRIVNQHSRLGEAAFQQLHGVTNLVCSSPDELAFASNSFDLMARSPETVSIFNAAMVDLTRFVTPDILRA